MVLLHKLGKVVFFCAASPHKKNTTPNIIKKWGVVFECPAKQGIQTPHITIKEPLFIWRNGYKTLICSCSLAAVS